VGLEALLRWCHPERGMVSPGVFIPLAEEMGLIRDLGNWCLRQASSDMAHLLSARRPLRKMAVNVSALQFGQTLVGEVEAALQSSGLRADALSLEVTEGIAMENSERTLNTLQALRNIGVRLSIDDFGTGYSSLSYLSRFPLNEMKIDRSFVDRVEDNAQQAGLVQTIIALSRSLELDLVAEGVETPGQYHFLQHQGANIIQGFLFSKPVSISELPPMLEAGYFAPRIREIGELVYNPSSMNLG
ncbi:MAG: putative bifunctional diguanylate cyclase/phosphodiesterase, partial [Parahaliea sp.]